MSLLRAGDFNHDGFDDLAVVAPLYRNGNNELTGCAVIYYGSKSGLMPAPGLVIEGSFPGSTSGISSCTTGDLNQDGFDDLVLGNNLYGEPQLDKGYIQFHQGSVNGLKATPEEVVTGRNNYGSFGSRLLTADYDGDGRDDLLVEARFDQQLEGRIYIYKGGRAFSVKKTDYTLAYPGSESLYLCFTADVDLDGHNDVVCRSNRNWNSHQTEISVFKGGPDPLGHPVKVIQAGAFIPMQYLTHPNVNGITMLGSVNTRSGKQISLTASLEEGHFSLSESKMEGSVFNTAIPEGESGDFFVRTSGKPVQLLHYQLQGEENMPVLIRNILLPDKSPGQFNGMVFLDTNGDGRREMVVAYTAGGREKMVVLGWE